MRKYIAAAVLSAGMLIASTAVSPSASAQDKTTTKKTTTKDGHTGGHIEIAKGKDGKFRFSVRDADGKFLAESRAYASEKDIHDGVEAFKKIVAGAKVSMKEGKESTTTKKKTTTKD